MNRSSGVSPYLPVLTLVSQKVTTSSLGSLFDLSPGKANNSCSPQAQINSTIYYFVVHLFSFATHSNASFCRLL